MRKRRSPRAASDTVHDWTVVHCLLVALAAAALTLFFFAPRFVIWKGLSFPDAWTNPELSRAVHTLRQVEQPWEDVRGRANKAISWRLLFPLIWHYCSLPRGLLLSMPFVGCLLALWLATWLNYRRLREWKQTWMATTIFAALPWFFASTGWLAYFDSWLVLALLVVSFVTSRAAVAFACLLAPWVDERFVLALPVAVVARVAAVRSLEEKQGRDVFPDIVTLVAATLPSVAVRVHSWLRGDLSSSSYVDAFWDEALHVPWSRLLDGLWSGYRAAWIMVLAAVWWSWKQMGRGWGVGIAILFGVTAIGGLFIAGDMSRTMMMLCPALLLGIWQWRKWQPASFRWVLPTLFAANLLLPASHVVWSFKSPILYLPAQLDEWRNPPEFLQPLAYVQRGQALMTQGKPAEAQRDFDTAIRLDGNFVEAYLRRAVVRIKEGDLNGAAADVETALRIEPNAPTTLFVRANLHRRRGDVRAATEDLKQALGTAPPDWPQRAEAGQLLETLTANPP